MRIFLIGYMGCGKSTAGRQLADKMGLHFIDMDHYIEERNYKTVAQIFAEEGEDAFRQKERKALDELAQFDDVVIATGGGAPCFFDNIKIMNNAGVTIFLNIDPAILADRLLASKIDRPLIKGKSREELVAFIDETLQKRKLFYGQAQIEITDPDYGLEELKKRILL